MVVKHNNSVSLIKTLLEELNNEKQPLDSLSENEQYELQQICSVINNFRRWFSGVNNQIRQETEDDDDVKKFSDKFRQSVYFYT